MLQEDLLCPSCRKRYDLPLLLPCSHSQCRACVLQEKNMAAAKRLEKPSRAPRFPAESCSVYCPACQGRVELPSPSWEAAMVYLPVNWALKSLLEGGEDSLGACMVARQALAQKEDREWNILRAAASADAKVTLQELEGSSAEADKGAPWTPPAQRPGGWRNEMDLAEEDMELSLKGLCFRLDPSTAHPLLSISPSGLQVAYTGPALPSCRLPRDPRSASVCNTESTSPLFQVRDGGGSTSPLYQVRDGGGSTSPLFQVRDSGGGPTNPPLPQVLADVSIKGGLFYWEVDVCNSRAYRLGVCSERFPSPETSRLSWCIERQTTDAFRVLYGDEEEPLDSVPPLVQRIGVCLNMTGGTLSFFGATTEDHFVTLPICFPCPVRPFFYLTHGKLSITSGLPLPAFVFTTKASTYRAGKGRNSSWHRDLIFRSISPFIQRFESLALEDNDEGFHLKMRSLCTRNMKCELETEETDLSNEKV